jgi:hypothetical protein
MDGFFPTASKPLQKAIAGLERRSRAVSRISGRGRRAGTARCRGKARVSQREREGENERVECVQLDFDTNQSM